MLKSLLLYGTIFLFAFAHHAQAQEFAIHDGDTVGFLGDSITAARTYGKIVENYTLLRFPDRKIHFLNLGIGGDTAEGGLKRLQRDVFDNHVTVLIVAFGINDIGWGMRADDEHRQTYLDSIRGIVTSAREHGVRVYICSAAVTAGEPDKTENDYLQQMCDEGLQIAKAKGACTIDVQRTMRAIQRKLIKNNESLPEENHESLHLPDGVHLNDLGHLAMAYAILKGLNAPDIVSSCTIDAYEPSVTETCGCEICDLNHENDILSFTRVDQGLPFNNGLFGMLAYRFVPMYELNQYRLTVQNLRPGKYTLTVSDREVGTWNADQLAKGLDIASVTPDGWQPGGPWDAQATVLKSLTDARHKIDSAVGEAKQTLSSSPILIPFAEESVDANAQLEKMQRLAAKPQPYKFVLTRKQK